MEQNLGLFIDFENVAAGTEKEGLGRFDIDALMGRIKNKGRILISRCYGDWGRFARFKQSLLTANITMVELTSHGMQDKNRADIAMVVDCLEFAFLRDYIDTFVLVSGDSDFTPLVIKLRELNKRVIGIGTRKSTSRLLVNACDEFIFYDTIIKDKQRGRQRVTTREGGSAVPKDRSQAFAVLEQTLDGMLRENPNPPLASVVKTSMLRHLPDFSESDLGFSSFARFLETAQKAGLISLSRDSKSGGYRVEGPEDSNGSNDDGRPRKSRQQEEDETFDDAYYPDGSAEIVAALTKRNHPPLGAPTRLALLEAFADAVTDRKKKKRRINLQFLQEDVKKRLRRSHPDLTNPIIWAVLENLMEAGMLIHKDGNPIRSSSAPFRLEKTAAELNTVLTNIYLTMAKKAGVDLSDSNMLAALFLGDKDRNREIEEVLAWVVVTDDDDDDDDLLLEDDAEDFGDDAAREESTLIELNDIDLDDILFVDEPEPEVAAQANAEIPASTMEDAVEEVAEPAGRTPVKVVAEADEKPKRTRTRRRTRKKEETEADAASEAADEASSLDALLAVDDDAPMPMPEAPEEAFEPSGEA